MATSVSAINRYFDRNHSYRATAPREFRFLAVNEHFTATTEAEQAQILDPMRSGTYAMDAMECGAERHALLRRPAGRPVGPTGL